MVSALVKCKYKALLMLNTKVNYELKVTFNIRRKHCAAGYGLIST